MESRSLNKEHLAKTLERHRMQQMQNLGLNDSFEYALSAQAAQASAQAGGPPSAPIAQTSPQPTDQEKAAVARWMGAEAAKRGLPPELPVMTALVESNLRNLNYGDRTSVGYFQQQDNWGTRAERLDPKISLAKFLSAAWNARNDTKYHWQMSDVRGSGRTIHLGAAISTLVASASSPQERAKYLGIWCQMVQRSAFSDRYAGEYTRATRMLGGG